jgi:hypothetical protein
MPSRTKVGLVFGAIALTVLALTLMRRDPRRAPAPVAPAPPAAESAIAEPEAAQVVDPDREQVDVAAVDDAAVAPPPAPRTAPARISGRCVAAESGRALAGVHVECTRLGSGERTPAAAPFTTGGDGRFELEVEVGGPRRLVAQAPGRSPRIAHLRALAPGAAIDLGDVSLAVGFVVEGQVLERDGAPVAGATVVLSAVFVGIEVGEDVPASLNGRTDAFGSFRIEGDVPAGEFPLGLSTRGWTLVSPAWVRVDPLAGAEPVAAVAERLPSIAGHVVDTDGVAVRGVRLNLAGGLMPTPAVSTDADGAFELFARGDDRTPRGVLVQDPGPCEPPEGPLPVFEWGTRDARIVLRRALTFELEVVERGSGAAVSEYAVICFRTDSNSSLERAARHAGTHPDGRLVVQRVRRGENHLQVRPASAELLDSDWIVFEAREGRSPLRVELERMSLGRVRVVTAAGEPVAGSRVSLHRREANPPAFGPVRVFDVGSPDEALHDGTDSLPRIAGGTSDARGELELPFPADLAACILRVTGAEHLELREPQPPLRAGAVHEVVVARGARVEGRCVVRGYGGGPLALQFARDGEPMTSEVLAPLGPDGEFRSPPLAPGDVAIHLSIPPGGNFVMRAPLEPPLLRVTLGEGEVLRLDLDARAWDAASVSGSVRVDGAAPASGQLLLLLELPGAKPLFGPRALHGEGGFAFDGLPPGRWTALLHADEPGYLHSSESFVLAGGERRDLQLEFSRTRRVLRVLAADGSTPLAGRPIVVLAGGEAHFATADEQGRARFAPSLSGEVEVFLEGTPHIVRVVLPEPGEAHALDVVLPIAP